MNFLSSLLNGQHQWIKNKNITGLDYRYVGYVLDQYKSSYNIGVYKGSDGAAVNSYKRIYIGIADGFSTDTAGNPVAINLTLHGPYAYSGVMNATAFNNFNMQGKYFAYVVRTNSENIYSPPIGVTISSIAPSMYNMDAVTLDYGSQSQNNQYTLYSFTYIPEDATFSSYSSDGYYGVTVNSKSAGIVFGTRQTLTSDVEYVFSSDRNAYPDDGEMNGDWYSYIGSASDDAGDRIHYGELFTSFTEDTSHTVVFPKAPKFVVISVSNKFGIVNRESNGSIAWAASNGDPAVGVTVIYPGTMKLTLWRDSSHTSSYYTATSFLKGKTLTISAPNGRMSNLISYEYPTKIMYFW